MVQTDVFGPKGLLPSVQYLRMDGSVEGAKRQDMVNRFNSDPSYDCLLLTTSVGGLGLNLTGADTVIFLEHDWNPQKDMQAMDRAHRIGQKKTVNVYRIVTRGTLEEKILRYVIKPRSPLTGTIANQGPQPPTIQDGRRLHSRQPTKRRSELHGDRPNPRSLQCLRLCCWRCRASTASRQQLDYQRQRCRRR